MTTFLIIVYCIFAFLTSELLKRNKDVLEILDEYSKEEDLTVGPKMWFTIRTFLGILWLPLMMYVIIMMYRDTFTDDDEDDDDFHPDLKPA